MRLATSCCFALVGLAVACTAFDTTDYSPPDLDAAPDTDADADTDSDTDADTDNDADTDSDADADADADADSDTDTDADTDTDSDCTPTDCDPPTYCNEVSGECEPCTVDDYCGPSCAACSDKTPTCEGATAATASCVCDATPSPHGSCGTGERCEAGSCVACASDDFCGDDCADCTATSTPHCDTTGGSCVECLDNADCRDVDGGVEPFNSPLGVCTPDKTCTCWIETETGTCTSTSCPDGYACAQDMPGDNHYACLRECTTTESPANGLTCESRNTTSTPELVWAPMTTCFAFNRFGLDCATGGTTICSVDGSGPLTDGSCVDDFCTYSCWDGSHHDNWCPNDVCVDANNYCETP